MFAKRKECARDQELNLPSKSEEKCVVFVIVIVHVAAVVVVVVIAAIVVVAVDVAVDIAVVTKQIKEFYHLKRAILRNHVSLDQKSTTTA